MFRVERHGAAPDLQPDERARGETEPNGMAGGGEEGSALRPRGQGQDRTGVARKNGVGEFPAASRREGVEIQFTVAGGRGDARHGAAGGVAQPSLGGGLGVADQQDDAGRGNAGGELIQVRVRSGGGEAADVDEQGVPAFSGSGCVGGQVGGESEMAGPAGGGAERWRGFTAEKKVECLCRRRVQAASARLRKTSDWPQRCIGTLSQPRSRRRLRKEPEGSCQ